MSDPMPASVFVALRRFAKPRVPVVRCDLFSLALSPRHAHMVEAATRKLICSCDACAMLFADRSDAKFLRVPYDPKLLPDFHMPDELWHELAIPINLAFFYVRTGGEVFAAYPSPAGAIEAEVSPDVWRDVVRANPAVADLKPEVEAVLVNRVDTPPIYVRAPIDECFKLVGIIRTRWRGLAGGTDVWDAVRGFYGELEARACRT